MIIIAGLGNPGLKHEINRHNMGFLAIDSFAKSHRLELKNIKFKSNMIETFIFDKKVILLKPTTYMNLSGDAIREVMNYYKCKRQNLLVIYDDIDIDFLKIRIRKKGSAGTHNGMRDIIYKLGYDEFARMRLGIGKLEGIELKRQVLLNFDKEELKQLKSFFKKTNEAINSFIKEGVDTAISRFNG